MNDQYLNDRLVMYIKRYSLRFKMNVILVNCTQIKE